ncbi:MAG: nucleotidyltransferase domain-containing protein [Bacteroidia bacterium]
MSIKESPVVKEVIGTFEKLYGKRLSKIFLYGSYARGTQTDESDIDFLILLKDKNVSPFKEIDFYAKELWKLSDKHGVEISVKAAGEKFFDNEYSLLARFIRKEGILITDKK